MIRNICRVISLATIIVLDLPAPRGGRSRPESAPDPRVNFGDVVPVAGRNLSYNYAPLQGNVEIFSRFDIVLLFLDYSPHRALHGVGVFPVEERNFRLAIKDGRFQNVE